MMMMWNYIFYDFSLFLFFIFSTIHKSFIHLLRTKKKDTISNIIKFYGIISSLYFESFFVSFFLNYFISFFSAGTFLYLFKTFYSPHWYKIAFFIFKRAKKFTYFLPWWFFLVVIWRKFKARIIIQLIADEILSKSKKIIFLKFIPQQLRKKTCLKALFWIFTFNLLSTRLNLINHFTNISQFIFHHRFPL